MLSKLILYLKIYYYTLLDWFNDSPISTETKSIEQSRQNIKLIRGVKKLVSRLRSMNPEDRTKEENLLGKDSYKKTRQELMEELRVRYKVLNNPILKTEDDLVHKVVQQAPAYARESELKDIRKQITACLKEASLDPSNPIHTVEAMRLKARREVLRVEIERIKNA
jgi:hypothetical protein